MIPYLGIGAQDSDSQAWNCKNSVTKAMCAWRCNTPDAAKKSEETVEAMS